MCMTPPRPLCSLCVPQNRQLKTGPDAVMDVVLMTTKERRRAPCKEYDNARPCGTPLRASHAPPSPDGAHRLKARITLEKR